MHQQQFINELSATLEDITEAPAIDMVVKPFPYNIMFDSIEYTSDVHDPHMRFNVQVSAQNKAMPQQEPVIIEGSLLCFKGEIVNHPNMNEYLIEMFLRFAHMALVEQDRSRRVKHTMQSIADRIVKEYEENQSSK